MGRNKIEEVEILMKKVFTALMMFVLFVPSAFGLSDNEYRQMMNDSDFRAIDSALNQAYRNAKNSLSASDFNALKKNQEQWVKSGRDNRVHEVRLIRGKETSPNNEPG